MSTALENRRIRARIVEALVIHGYLTTPQLVTYTGLSITDEAMEKRLKRMKADGLIEEQVVVRRPDLSVPCWRASPAAIRLAGDGLPYVKRISESRARHALTVAQVAIDLRAAGHHVTTERELILEERTHRTLAGTTLAETRHGSHQAFVMPNGTRLRKFTRESRREWYDAHTPAHRPDLRLDPAGRLGASAALPEAWEIELSHKTKSRVEEKLRWLARAGMYSRVVYLCATPALAELVTEAAHVAAPTLNIDVSVLSPEYAAASVDRRTVVGRPVVKFFLATANSAASDSLPRLGEGFRPTSHTATHRPLRRSTNASGSTGYRHQTGGRRHRQRGSTTGQACDEAAYVSVLSRDCCTRQAAVPAQQTRPVVVGRSSVRLHRFPYAGPTVAGTEGGEVSASTSDDAVTAPSAPFERRRTRGKRKLMPPMTDLAQDRPLDLAGLRAAVVDAPERAWEVGWLLGDRALAGDEGALAELRNLAVHHADAVVALSWALSGLGGGLAEPEIAELSGLLDNHPGGAGPPARLLGRLARHGDEGALAGLRNLSGSHPEVVPSLAKILGTRAGGGDDAALEELSGLAGNHPPAADQVALALSKRAYGGDDLARERLRDLATRDESAVQPWAVVLAGRATNGDEGALEELRHLVVTRRRGAAVLAKVLRRRAEADDAAALAELRSLAEVNNQAAEQLILVLGQRAGTGDADALVELGLLTERHALAGDHWALALGRRADTDDQAMAELRHLEGQLRRATEQVQVALAKRAAAGAESAATELQDRAARGEDGALAALRGLQDRLPAASARLVAALGLRVLVGDDEALAELRELAGQVPLAAGELVRAVGERALNDDGSLDELRSLARGSASAADQLALTLGARARGGSGAALDELRDLAGRSSFAGDCLVEVLRDLALHGSNWPVSELRTLARQSAHALDCLAEVLRPRALAGDLTVSAELAELAESSPKAVDQLAADLGERARAGETGALRELRALAGRHPQAAGTLARLLAGRASCGESKALADLRTLAARSPQAAGPLAVVLRDLATRGDSAALRELVVLADRSVHAAVQYTKAVRRLTVSVAAGAANTWLVAGVGAQVLGPGDALDARWKGSPLRVRHLLRAGVGAMTYRVSAPSDGREWAVKLSPLALVSDDWSEMEAYGQLSHPNIARLSMVRLTDDDQLLIAVDYYADGTLRELLATRTSGLDLDDALDVVRQAALGLAHAHAQGVVHGDVKPSNIAVVGSPRGAARTVRLLDFGASVRGGEQTGDRRTRAARVSATPLYCAPEQSTGSPGEASDVYSLGCVLYELLTGRTVFAGQEDPDLLFSQHRFSVPERIGRAEVPASVEGLLGRMLAKDPVDRPTAYEVGRFLQGHVSEVPGLAVWDWRLDATMLFERWAAFEELDDEDSDE